MAGATALLLFGVRSAAREVLERPSFYLNWPIFGFAVLIVYGSALLSSAFAIAALCDRRARKCWPILALVANALSVSIAVWMNSDVRGHFTF